VAVDAQPDLIYAMNLGYIVAAHQRTKTIPIVMGSAVFRSKAASRIVWCDRARTSPE